MEKLSNRSNSFYFKGEAGILKVLPLLLIIAAIGVISFLLISSTGPFNGIFNPIFPKPPSQAAATGPSFGVNAHLMWQGINATIPDLDRMKQDGILMVRFDLPWIWLEPNQKGIYDAPYLQRLDDTMAAIAQRGMRPIVTFLQPPTWALGTNCADLNSHLCPPQNMQDYADTYAFLANRYKNSNPSVVWEVWNEPNLQVFWRTNGGPNARDYTLMLQKTYTSIKQVAPQTTVIGGVVAFNDQNFLDGMYANGAKGYFDGLDIHPYAKNHPPSDTSEPFYSFKASIEQMEAKMAQNGEAGKPIYITEMGWDSTSVADQALRANYYQQAVQMVRSYSFAVALAPYTFKPVVGDDTSQANALVLNGVATPAWTAYIQEVALLPSLPIVAGCTIFPADNIWNTPINTLPVHPNSANYIASIGTATNLHPDFGAGTFGGGPIGIPFIVVPGSQPKVPVSFTYAGESDPGPYPIPANPPIEGGPNSSGDRHILMIDKDNCKLYELFSAFPPGNGWTAGSGAIFDLNSNNLRTAGWTSADAAGLPILPGLIRYDEIAAGSINHAIRFTASQTQKAYIWPARHFASSNTSLNLPPMGIRVRLKTNFNISSFSLANQVILKAMKKYGMILADNGSSWFFSGAPDDRFDNDDLHTLTTIAGSNFEVVDESSLQVSANSGQAKQTPVSPAPSITASPTPSPQPTPIPGDIDKSGKVDIFDYNILVGNFNKTGTGIQGDLDGNGKVDIFDYNILVTNFGRTL